MKRLMITHPSEGGKDYGLKIFLILVFALFIIHSSIIINQAHAQEASSSGSLIQKLDELKKDIASKAAEIKTAVNKKVQNKAIFGRILTLDDTNMTIQTPTTVKPVNFDEFTEVIGSNNKKIKITTLEEGDDVAALGDFDDKGNLAGKRIVFLDKYATSSGELVWGQIQKTTGNVITVKDKSGANRIITTNSETTYLLGNNEASIADARVEKFMVAKGTVAKDNSLRAKFIYFIPAVGFVKPSEKSASPSAKPKP